MAKRDEVIKATREAAERDLLTFIKLVAPNRVLGSVHEELIAWWTRQDAKDNQLTLLPRDHQKSAMIAYRVAWWLTAHPDATILYVSATADLAEKQLKFIKDIITSDTYRMFWPEMINTNENKRERWTNEEIAVDHPRRKAEYVRDPSIKAVGLTANTTGLHCSLAVLDDVVVPGNAYTEVGREQTRAFYSQLSSIETTGAKEWVVGTRYHPSDLYKDMVDMREFYSDENGEDLEVEVFEIFERKVEVNGEFLWPKQRRHDGKTFGFDEKELARKKAKYLDVTQFYAQYYNNPNAQENQHIDSSKFQYYDRAKLSYLSGSWVFEGEELNIYAGVDFSYGVSATADFTAIVIVGVSPSGRFLVLDIDRFRTNKISETYDRIVRMYKKWKFKKLRAEVTHAQQMIVNQLKEFMRASAVSFSIDEHRPLKNKEERMLAILEPKYTNLNMWHYKGGNCQILEEELMLEHPEHDDVKDCLASVLEVAQVPAWKKRWNKDSEYNRNVIYSSRFGGVAFT